MELEQERNVAFAEFLCYAKLWTLHSLSYFIFSTTYVPGNMSWRLSHVKNCASASQLLGGSFAVYLSLKISD